MSVRPSGATPTSNITIWQKLDLLPAILNTLMGTAVTALAAPFRGTHAPKTFRKHVLVAMMRRVVGRFSPTQLQWLVGTTGSNYSKWAKVQGIQPQNVFIQKGKASAFWIGSPDAKLVGLYFHGGGFNMPASDGQFTFLSQISTKAAASGKSLAFLILQYDLAPAKHYPFQLKQCVELLRYAVTELTKSPRELLLGGDSAGGNLVFGVLLHLMHPHPSIEPLKLSQPLRAAFASSPWLDFEMNSSRFQGSDASDAAPLSTLKTWAYNYVGSTMSDNWREPARSNGNLWQGLANVIDDILITVAKEEMMADDIMRMATKIKENNESEKVSVFVANDDFHAQPALGPNVGLGTGEAAEVISSWIVERC